ncbi:TBC domain-containing protein, partial [Smittium mucronatum]
EVEEKKISKSQGGGIQKMLSKWWTQYLKPVDPELWDYMDSLGYNPQDFALRWLLVWCCREYSLDDVVKLWDYIISDRAICLEREKLNNKDSSIPYLLDGNEETLAVSINPENKKNPFFGNFKVPTISDGFIYSYTYPYHIEDLQTILRDAERSPSLSEFDEKNLNISGYNSDEHTINIESGHSLKDESKFKKSHIEDINGSDYLNDDLYYKDGFLMDVCVAMVITMREKILKSDFSEGMMAIQSFSQKMGVKVPIDTIIGLAKSIKLYRNKYRNRMPISGLIGDLKRQYDLELRYPINNQVKQKKSKREKKCQSMLFPKNEENQDLDKDAVEPPKLISIKSDPIIYLQKKEDFRSKRLGNEIKYCFSDEKVLSKVCKKLNSNHRYSKKIEGKISKQIKLTPIKINVTRKRFEENAENECFKLDENNHVQCKINRNSDSDRNSYIRLSNSSFKTRMENNEPEQDKKVSHLEFDVKTTSTRRSSKESCEITDISKCEIESDLKKLKDICQKNESFDDGDLPPNAFLDILKEIETTKPSVEDLNSGFGQDFTESPPLTAIENLSIDDSSKKKADGKSQQPWDDGDFPMLQQTQFIS